MSQLLFSMTELQSRLGGYLHSERQWAMQEEQLTDPRVGVRSFSIDSRTLGAGDLFFPLPGEQTDGHNFLFEAARSGCRAMLVSRAHYQSRALEIKRLVEEFPLLVFPVSDVLASLHLLARLVIRRHSLLKIGVTGSNGKTTTKELIASILKREAPCFMTPGNYNSILGLPVAAARIESRHKYGVFEMAMSEKGEMRKLSDLVFPDVVVLTGIGSAHIGNIGSQMAIAEEKFEIFRNFQPDNLAILPEDDAYVKRLEHKARGRKLYYGPHQTQGFQGLRAQGLGWQEFAWRGQVIRLNLNGEHNLMNALAAISLAEALGIRDESIVEGLKDYRPIFGRGEFQDGRVRLLLDCYNANPESMTASIKAFMNQEDAGRKVLILGDMKELGRFSGREHANIGILLAESLPDLVILYGEEMQAAWESAKDHLDPGVLHWTSDWESLEALVRDLIREGDMVLLKASRSMSLEKLEPVLVSTKEVR